MSLALVPPFPSSFLCHPSIRLHHITLSTLLDVIKQQEVEFFDGNEKNVPTRNHACPFFPSLPVIILSLTIDCLRGGQTRKAREMVACFYALSKEPTSIVSPCRHVSVLFLFPKFHHVYPPPPLPPHSLSEITPMCVCRW